MTEYTPLDLSAKEGIDFSQIYLNQALVFKFSGHFEQTNNPHNSKQTKLQVHRRRNAHMGR